MTDAPQNSIAIHQPQAKTPAAFSTAEGFELIQRIGSMFAKSDLVPDKFKGNNANCIIGVELAARIGANPLMVMQNLDIIYGRPSWRSQFIISAINTCGKFSPLRFRVTGAGDELTCVAYAVEHATGETLEGPPVSIGMAKAEGWYGRTGSKWKSMGDLMLRYRAAAFFGRLYAPEILMGMQTVEEVLDVADAAKDVTPPKAEAVSDLNAQIAKAAAEKPKKKKEAPTPPPVIEAEAIDMGDAAPEEPASNDDYF